MAIYLVGDVQGCYQELQSLLTTVAFNVDHDQLWLTGDLVARGPDSLATLRFIKGLGNSAKVVLGNHDLHLLAVHAGIKKVKRNDRLDALLAADDIDELMDWLATFPLVEQLPGEAAYMSHAGLSPHWQPQQALTQSKFVQQRINSSQRTHWLTIMYGNTPSNWLDVTTEEQEFRYSVNALTRMRFCYSDGALEFTNKGSPHLNTAPELAPWFEFHDWQQGFRWVFGHWASLNGDCISNNVFPLDTGCVWGGKMTMLRWHDKKFFTVAAFS